MYASTPGLLIESGLYAFGRTVSCEMMNVYALRMAGVSMISTCTLSLRTGIFPRRMASLGLVPALCLLLSLGAFHWAPLVFPLRVLLISLHILLANARRSLHRVHLGASRSGERIPPAAAGTRGTQTAASAVAR